MKRPIEHSDFSYTRLIDEWPFLFQEIRKHMENGTRPTDPIVQDLAERWLALLNGFAFSGVSIKKQFSECSPTPEMFFYIHQSLHD